MAKLEETILKNFVNDKVLLFCQRQISFNKLEYSKHVHNALNNFEKNLKFTFDIFINVAPRFLNIETHPDGFGIYCKDTSAGQYTYHNSCSA